MTPISMGGCFAWLHCPQGSAKSLGAVVCPGLKTDELNGYGPLRLLAERLADQGYPTVRLHYLGTGDSSDPAEPVDHWKTWQQSIHDAADWFRQDGADQIVLCGLRFGAMLAATVAADRTDVAGLVLLTPVLRGRSYVRQLKMETGHSPDGYIDAGRYRLAPATISQISRTELRKIPLRAGCKAVAFSRSSAALTECIESWRKRNVDISESSFDGLEAMLRPTFAIHKKPPRVDPIVTWVTHNMPVGYRNRAPLTRPLEQISVRIGQCVETPLFFGINRSLFGILCRPERSTKDLVVVMVNSSGDPHCGGTTVDVARHLADEGFASFRIDFAGIGDSFEVIEQHLFETDRTSDCSAAIDAMVTIGYRRFAIYGLCSGAYHAYHAAAADSRISFAVLINLPFFKWVPGTRVEDLIFDIRPPTHFLAMIKTKAFWKTLLDKLIGGELGIRKRFTWLEQKLRQLRSIRNAATVVELSKRVKLLFLVSDGDVSVEILRHEFGSKSLPIGTKIELIPGLDHSISGARMRKIVASCMAAFLAGVPLA